MMIRFLEWLISARQKHVNREIKVLIKDGRIPSTFGMNRNSKND